MFTAVFAFLEVRGKLYRRRERRQEQQPRPYEVLVSVDVKWRIKGGSKFSSVFRAEYCHTLGVWVCVNQEVLYVRWGYGCACLFFGLFFMLYVYIGVCMYVLMCVYLCLVDAYVYGHLPLSCVHSLLVVRCLSNRRLTGRINETGVVARRLAWRCCHGLPQCVCVFKEEREGMQLPSPCAETKKTSLFSRLTLSFCLDTDPSCLDSPLSLRPGCNLIRR